MRSKLMVSAVVISVAVATFAAAGVAEVGHAKKFTGDPILIGSHSSEDITTASVLEEIRPSIQAAIKTVNAGGGVKTSDGKTHELKLVFCNNKSDPNESERCANEMIEQNVVALVGAFDQNSKVSYPIYFQNGLASFANQPATGTEFASAVSYPIVVGTVPLFAGLGVVAAEHGIKKVRPLGVQGQEAQTNPVLKVIEGALNEGGAEMLDPISIPGTTQDFAPVLAQALEGDPDGLFPFVDESFNGRIATAAAQAPDTFEWMGVYGTITPDLVTQTGGAKGPLEGAILTAQWQPPTAKVWAVYRKSMKKYASKTQQEPASQNAWLGTILLAEDILPVIEGEVTRESVKAQLDATDALDTRGATAKPIDFTAPFPCGVVARTFNTFYWGAQIVKSGKIKDVKGAEWSDAADLVIEGFGSLCDLAPSVAAPGAA